MKITSGFKAPRSELVEISAVQIAKLYMISYAARVAPTKATSFRTEYVVCEKRSIRCFESSSPEKVRPSVATMRIETGFA